MAESECARLKVLRATEELGSFVDGVLPSVIERNDRPCPQCADAENF